MTVIAVCTTTNLEGFRVLVASLQAYAPDVTLVHLNKQGLFFGKPRAFNRTHWADELGWAHGYNNYNNFGEAYNAVMAWTFDRFKREDGIVIANDDVVVTPTTLQNLQADLLRVNGGLNERPLGLLGARSDFVLPAQNIRCHTPQDRLVWLRYEGESSIKRAEVIAPIFAYVPRKAYEAQCKGRGDQFFPPINWYSDNVVCADLTALGYQHYVSTAYVHHAGSQTVGHDAERLTAEAKAWISVHRPQYMGWFK